MISVAWAAPVVADLATIDLTGLDARAARQARVDRKYLVPVRELDELVAAVLDAEPGARVLEIDGQWQFSYCSVYHDTPQLTAYHDAARRRRRRFKVRTRTYLDSGLQWVEVKTRGARGTTIKHRLPREFPRTTGLGLDRSSEEFAHRVLGFRGRLDLSPTLQTHFTRTTLHLPSSESRLTIDTDLVWTSLRPGGRHHALSGIAIVETKSGATPSSADRRLWRSGLRPVRVSKYGVGLAALDPHLPASPWRRTLDRHVLPHLTPLTN